MRHREGSIEALVSREHRRLDALFTESLETLAANAEPSEVLAAFTHLRETLDQHLLQEERLYYSALRALLPAHRSALLDFADVHETFRTRMAALEEHFRPAAREGTRTALAAIARDFERHEAAEERLLREIDREVETRTASLESRDH